MALDDADGGRACEAGVLRAAPATPELKDTTAPAPASMPIAAAVSSAHPLTLVKNLGAVSAADVLGRRRGAGGEKKKDAAPLPAAIAGAVAGGATGKRRKRS